jgi:hypothetical protein
MNLMQQAKADVESILGNTSEFAMELTFIAPNSTELTTTGQFFDRTAVFSEGETDLSTKHVVIHVSEKPFTDADYPMRIDGVISFKNHLVRCTYADGRIITFKVFDTQPDESINMITLQLQTYGTN